MDFDHGSHRPSKRPRFNLPPLSWAVSTQERLNLEFPQHPTAKLGLNYDSISLPPPNRLYESASNSSLSPKIGPELAPFSYAQPTYPPLPVDGMRPPVPQPYSPYQPSQAERSIYASGTRPQLTSPALEDNPGLQSHIRPLSQAHSATPPLQDVTNRTTWPEHDYNAQVNVPCSPASNQSETVSHIPGTCEQLGTVEILPEFPVRLNSPGMFSLEGKEDMSGRIQSAHSQMIHGLLEEQTLELHVNCVLNTHSAKTKSFRKSKLLPCILEITVYGPLDLYDEIGSWFQEYEIYLQDPRICHLDVRYYNPHRLSSDNLESHTLVSEVINKNLALIPLQHVVEQTDMLDVLSNSADLEETPQPEAIRATLKKHQKQALTFMLHREKGSINAEGCKDIWETVNNDHGRVFVNTITNTYQTEEPPQFSGGIIADPMGLGKTLSMISLVATDIDARYGLRALDTERGIGTTLIIIPPPLIGTWEEQLNEHVFGDCLKYCRHHGKTRLKDLTELENVNVVLTTFHTVSAEWSADASAADSILFSVRWRRVILDEAHFIRNGNSRMSRAVCALESECRWAVTGTPIQNRLTDLATLFKFVRVHPYSDPRRFESDISNLWKSGEEEEAVRRLKRLSAFLLLRRPKGTINLPARQNLLLPVDFNHEERQVYDSMRNQVITRIDEALHGISGVPRASSYRNALQQIESLRLFCNLGLRYHSRHKSDGGLLPSSEEWLKVAQRTFDSQREITPISCRQCSSVAEPTAEWLNEPSTTRRSAQFFECLKFVCGDCMDKLNRSGHSMTCGHNPSCAVAAVSTNSTALEETPDLEAAEMGTSFTSLPSKIKALVADLKNKPTGVKCVIFSTWRLTLDVVQAGLSNAGIRSTRFDGKVPQKDRQSVIDNFRADPSVRVMLLTLSCGAVGLTLTVASRAYLMEPHWNPTLEEQALARVHRLGQEKEVTTQVMQVQESKKQLAGVLLSPHDGKNTDNSLVGLEKLRALL
ncbi:SNF2 family N-terminal domain-containing protein [Annulohypoxylon maeteangense]|uniref:SNF2 family N-terminal domain-containing protein n=1 Tax=Annulohypoxylon maeteangense TaxID=1927788 RepID=UPI00200889C3|nr:SNF2 family N-terminal domain-containing protein [Annulohypoxylon maeteangense]KAI0883701.1 SNF2 family N-terminal domain-containing protein [Annulohypoxylon maeteangense]